MLALLLATVLLVPSSDAFSLCPTAASLLRANAASPLFSPLRVQHLHNVPGHRQFVMMAETTSKPKLVGVIGATGGVGRLCVAALLERGFSVRAIVRDKVKAQELLPPSIELVEADMCKPDAGAGLAVAIKGVDALVLCTGTTAFPSDKWGKA
jgi:hypothetical protein